GLVPASHRVTHMRLVVDRQVLGSGGVDVGELFLAQLLAVFGVQLGHGPPPRFARALDMPYAVARPILVPLTVERPFHIVLRLVRTSVRFPARTSLEQILE